MFKKRSKVGHEWTVSGVDEQQVEAWILRGAAGVKRNIFIGIHLSNAVYRPCYISYGV